MCKGAGLLSQEGGGDSTLTQKERIFTSESDLGRRENTFVQNLNTSGHVSSRRPRQTWRTKTNVFPFFSKDLIDSASLPVFYPERRLAVLYTICINKESIASYSVERMWLSLAFSLMNYEASAYRVGWRRQRVAFCSFFSSFVYFFRKARRDKGPRGGGGGTVVFRCLLLSPF